MKRLITTGIILSASLGAHADTGTADSLLEFHLPVFVALTVLVAGFWVWTLQMLLSRKTRSLRDHLNEMKKLHHEANREKDLLSNLINQSPLIIAVLNISLKPVLINETLRNIMGLDPDVPLNNQDLFIKCLHPDDVDDTRKKIFRSLDNPEEVTIHTSRISCNNLVISVEWYFKPLASDRKTSYIICNGIDLSARRIMETNMIMSTKIESVSKLAGGIAHDFNNLLTAIIANIAYIREQVESQDLEEIIQETETATSKALLLTNQLLLFSHGEKSDMSVESMKVLIDGALPFILSGSNISYDITTSTNLWHTRINRAKITQALYNLTSNSINAMPRGGTIHITLENMYLREENTLPLPRGKYLKITVRDEGEGIPDTIQNKIFDPFFTTTQSGSGLGLPTAFSIIKEHNGHLLYDNRNEGGACFILYLPATDEKAPVAQEVDDQVELKGKRVLVMDDEEVILKVAGRMLARLDIDYQTTRHGNEAIAAYREAREAGQPFDVVILDLTIPGGMGGRETVGHILEYHPDARIIVSSGYTNDKVLSEYRQHGFADVLVKPYQVDTLATVLQRVISR